MIRCQAARVSCIDQTNMLFHRTQQVTIDLDPVVGTRMRVSAVVQPDFSKVRKHGFWSVALLGPRLSWGEGDDGDFDFPWPGS